MNDEILDRLTAALVDTYEVEGALGEGGMALVYLARDIKHDRQVAIKVLKPDLAASLGAERFLQEIRITAKLQHPHILPLYDSGEADGFLYYVMPFVEGESLADLVAREKQLSIDEAIQITKEVAGALGNAHAYGLIHRDIKPDNIMMSGGHAIVADFGIAKAVSEAGGSGITSTGTSIGTAAYMSPEQAASDPNLDGRTDIYALGCMLYEMLVGQPPFSGPNAQAIIARHTMDQVPPPSIMRQTIMPEVEDVIFCAMAKTPADRFRTAQEMVEALTSIESGGSPKMRTTRATSRISVPVVEQPRWKRVVIPVGVVLAAVALGMVAWGVFFADSGSGVGSVAGEFAANRIAVLYFEDLSPNGELEYVADGLTEELIDRLNRVGALDVISRNGVAQFQDSDASRGSIARELEAGTLIDGSVMPMGERVRVNWYLVDGESDTDLERGSFELPVDQSLAIQDSIAEDLTEAIRTRLGEEVQLRAQRAASNNEAWLFVRRGERLRKEAEARLEEGDPGAAFATFDRADSVLQLAQAADPEWTAPLVLRGQIAYRRSRLAEELPDIERWIEAGQQHAAQVLSRDDAHAEALELRGTLRYFHWLLGLTPDPDQADEELNAARLDLERAVEEDPSLASAYSTLSHLYYQIDTDVPSALRAARRAYEEDAYLTVAPEVLWRLFLASYDLEDIAGAQQWCAEGQGRFAEDYRFTECRLWVMTTPRVDPEADSAWSLYDRLVALAPEPIREYRGHRARMIVGGVLARAGLSDSARAVLLGARAGFDVDPTGELPFIEAYIRTLVGDNDVAVELLEQIVATSDDPENAIDVDYWWWRDLRNHAGFRDLTGAS